MVRDSAAAAATPTSAAAASANELVARGAALSLRCVLCRGGAWLCDTARGLVRCRS
jgi:hypothetical protein